MQNHYTYTDMYNEEVCKHCVDCKHINIFINHIFSGETTIMYPNVSLSDPCVERPSYLVSISIGPHR